MILILSNGRGAGIPANAVRRLKKQGKIRINESISRTNIVFLFQCTEFNGLSNHDFYGLLLTLSGK